MIFKNRFRRINVIVNTTQDTFKKDNYKKHIDGLRAISVVAVVLYHAFPTRISGGYVGVDIFFVLSGYLITEIIITKLNNHEFSFLEFYARRIKRIFPSLITVILFVYIIGWWFLLPSEFKMLGKHIFSGALFGSNFVLWDEHGYFEVSSKAKPLLHLWSLGIEEQFYIIWPLLLFVLYRYDLKVKLIFFAIIPLSFICYEVFVISNRLNSAFYMPVTRFWEIISGGALSYYEINKKIKNNAFSSKTTDFKNKVIPNLISIIGIILCVGSMLLFHEGKYSAMYMFIPIMGTLLILIAGNKAWINYRFLSCNTATWVGKISYPLYLWHWPLLSYLYILDDFSSKKLRIGIIGFSFFLAWLTYKYIENPLRYKVYRPTRKLSLMMVLVGLVGLLTYVNDGYQFRASSAAKSLLNFHYDYSLEYREGSCFLKPEQKYSNFSKCINAPVNPDNKILLWGDSYAAHLYQGIKKRYANKSKIIQLTASSCPPILDYDVIERPNCREINDYIISRVKNEMPDTIILAASWHKYEWEKLESTLVELKNLHVKEVLVVGPVPIWKDSLPNILVRKYRSKIPLRSSVYVESSIFKLDYQMKNYLINNNVSYISPIDIFCNQGGCMTMINSDLNSLTSFDSGHLTTTASIYLVSHF
jgi:peptidoglycan/LPS O-acetylase OafA/YrhL